MATSRPPPSQRLNPLATAKGQKLLCELTGKPASIVVNYFGVPYYYCDRSTLELDWNGIKQKIAQLLVPLRQPPSVIPSVEERERQEANVRKSKLALIDLCRMEATKFLVHGDFELSIPGAVQALRYSLDVYGAGKIELVPCYLLLAEANLGLGRHKQAEEYLSLANWSILKNPDCSNRTKSQLYRNFGKLYASQGKHDEALRQLANDVYFSSLQVGPEHIETAGGYYYIATVFYLQRRIDCALAMCDKVVDIWLKHVSGLIDPSKLEGTEEVEPLGESQLMDGLQTLTKIVALREESMGADHITTGEALYTVSLVYVYAKDNQRAIQLMEKAYNIYYWELGPDSKRTQELAESIRLAGGVPQAPTGERPARKVPAADIAEEEQESAPAQEQAPAVPERAGEDAAPPTAGGDGAGEAPAGGDDTQAPDDEAPVAAAEESAAAGAEEADGEGGAEPPAAEPAASGDGSSEEVPAAPAAEAAEGSGSPPEGEGEAAPAEAEPEAESAEPAPEAPAASDGGNEAATAAEGDGGGDAEGGAAPAGDAAPAE